MRVFLPARNWILLEAFIAVPDKKHSAGGLQNRRRRWKTQLDERFSDRDKWARGAVARDTPNECFIDLDDDDVDFIQRTLGNANGGGFQGSIADVFTDMAPEFRGIPREKKR